MNFNLNNKNIFVSAASTGIGKAVAELFLNENCNVTICSSRIDKLKAASDELSKFKNSKFHFVKCDINNDEEIQNAVKDAESKFGRIDVLVNNCGGPAPGFFDDLDDSKWEYGFEQVLMSAVRFSRLVLPKMKENKWGRIINITSISVKQPIDNLLLSNAFRSGVTAFAKTLSNQVGHYNITVNNVAPGLTLTGRLQELAEIRAKDAEIKTEEMLINMAADIPLKRIGKPEEIAAAVVFLASEPAAYITGQTIVVDGGINKSTY